MDWYFTRTNVDPLLGNDDYDEEILPGVDHICFLGEPTGFDPLDGEEDAVLDEDYQIAVVQASDQEKAEWGAAHQGLLSGLEGAAKELEEAWNEFVRKRNDINLRRGLLWSTYAPIQKAIQERQEAVSQAFEDKAKGAEVLAQEAAQRAQDEEDAHLGPRLFYVTRPEQRGLDNQEMDVPTVHHIDCGIARRLRKRPDPVRIETAFEQLMDGGLRATKMNYRWEPDKNTKHRLPGVACERCQAFTLLRAHAPDTFDHWLERTESSQQADLPRDTWTGNQQFFKLLGVPRGGRTEKDSGYTRVDSSGYKEKGWVERHEEMIGWWDKEENVLSHDTERLKALFSVLPGRGLAVRWIDEEWGGVHSVSDQAVAVRRMTKWELRQHKAAK
jgi:hypothetical protein